MNDDVIIVSDHEIENVTPSTIFAEDHDLTNVVVQSDFSEGTTKEVTETEGGEEDE